MLEFIVAAICIVLSLLFFINKKCSTIKEPPGPKGIPIFGNLFQMDYENIYLTLHQLSLKYGDIFQLNFFGQKLVILSTSKIIRDVCLHEPNATICAARPATFIGKYGHGNYSGIVFSSYDKRWMMRRKLAHIQVKAYGEGLVHIENQVNKNLSLVKIELKRIMGQSVCPKDIIEEFIFNTLETLGRGNIFAIYESMINLNESKQPRCISLCYSGVDSIRVIGQCYGKHGELQKVLKKINDDGNTIANPGIDVLFSLFPFLRFLPLRISYLAKDYCDEQRLMMDILSRISGSGNTCHFRQPSSFVFIACNSSGQHLVYNSLTRWKKNPYYRGVYQGFMEEVNKIEGGEINITEQNVRGILTDLVSAGFLTTRGALVSAVQILATRPELQKSLQEEIDSIIGREREPSLKDRENCPRTESFLLETLRYISHVPISVPHFTSDSCEINKFHIDKGTIVVPNLWTAHHSSGEWKMPFDFLPERFLDESGDLFPATDHVRKSVVAFGIGKRSCIGEVFARSRMFLFMATLMQTVTITGTDRFELDKLKPGIVLEPSEYKVKFIPRE